jgi:hypothetical protein
VAGIAALAVVESFELLDGFGITASTYDPWDLLANAVGVGAAWAVAALADRRSTARTAQARSALPPHGVRRRRGP